MNSSAINGPLPQGSGFGTGPGCFPIWHLLITHPGGRRPAKKWNPSFRGEDAARSRRALWGRQANRCSPRTAEQTAHRTPGRAPLGVCGVCKGGSSSRRRRSPLWKVYRHPSRPRSGFPPGRGPLAFARQEARAGSGRGRRRRERRADERPIAGHPSCINRWASELHNRNAAHLEHVTDFVGRPHKGRNAKRVPVRPSLAPADRRLSGDSPSGPDDHVR